MKILHLSDLHLGARGMLGRADQLIDRLLKTLTPPSQYAIVVTGDLVDNPFCPGSYRKVRERLDRLRACGYAVLVIPGNHDYGPGGLMFSRWVTRFKQNFYGDQQPYPRLDILGNTAFLGLDSQAGEFGWWHRFWAQGKLGTDQLGRLRDLLDREDVRKCRHRVVYLHHHPFDPKPVLRLKDSDSLRKTLEGFSVDAILFGHNHDAKVWNGHWGIPRAYDAGTSTGKGHKPVGPHRVMDLDQDPATDWDAGL